MTAGARLDFDQPPDDPPVRRPAGSPARALAGPLDDEDLDPERPDGVDRTDFGSLRLPVPPGGTVDVEPSAGRKLQAVQITVPQGMLSVSALAAPTTERLWPELAKEINSSLREAGARVRSVQGRWGRELRARSGDAVSVFVGVDGPRWMVYGVATGPAQNARVLDRELRRVLTATVVVRGPAPYPVRTVLPLELPEEMQAERDARVERERIAAEALQAQEARQNAAVRTAAVRVAARERAAAERVAAEQAAREQVVASRVAAERAAAQERALAERGAAQERVMAAERAARERAVAERVARERALAEQAGRERALAEQADRERAAAEQSAAEQAERARVADRERAAAERTAARRAAAERAYAEAARSFGRPGAPVDRFEPLAESPADLRTEPDAAAEVSLPVAETTFLPAVGGGARAGRADSGSARVGGGVESGADGGVYGGPALDDPTDAFLAHPPTRRNGAARFEGVRSDGAHSHGAHFDDTGFDTGFGSGGPAADAGFLPDGPVPGGGGRVPGGPALGGGGFRSRDRVDNGAGSAPWGPAQDVRGPGLPGPVEDDNAAEPRDAGPRREPTQPPSGRRAARRAAERSSLDSAAAASGPSGPSAQPSPQPSPQPVPSAPVRPRLSDQPLEPLEPPKPLPRSAEPPTPEAPQSPLSPLSPLSPQSSLSSAQPQPAPTPPAALTPSTALTPPTPGSAGDLLQRGERPSGRRAARRAAERRAAETAAQDIAEDVEATTALGVAFPRVPSAATRFDGGSTGDADPAVEDETVTSRFVAVPPRGEPRRRSAGRHRDPLDALAGVDTADADDGVDTADTADADLLTDGGSGRHDGGFGTLPASSGAGRHADVPGRTNGIRSGDGDPRFGDGAPWPPDARPGRPGDRETADQTDAAETPGTVGTLGTDVPPDAPRPRAGAPAISFLDDPMSLFTARPPGRHRRPE